MFHEGPVAVTVLEAMKAQEGKQEMCHAAVSTESEFFLVKVFNKKLKDKFTPSKIIMISKCCNSSFLEMMLNFPGVTLNLTDQCQSILSEKDGNTEGQ